MHKKKLRILLRHMRLKSGGEKFILGINLGAIFVLNWSLEKSGKIAFFKVMHYAVYNSDSYSNLLDLHQNSKFF